MGVITTSSPLEAGTSGLCLATCLTNIFLSRTPPHNAVPSEPWQRGVTVQMCRSFPLNHVERHSQLEKALIWNPKCFQCAGGRAAGVCFLRGRWYSRKEEQSASRKVAFSPQFTHSWGPLCFFSLSQATLGRTQVPPVTGSVMLTAHSSHVPHRSWAQACYSQSPTLPCTQSSGQGLWPQPSDSLRENHEQQLYEKLQATTMSMGQARDR